jgi:hypothetical protein
MRASKEGTSGSNRQFRTRAGHLQSWHGHRILSVSGDGPARMEMREADNGANAD